MTPIERMADAQIRFHDGLYDGLGTTLENLDDDEARRNALQEARVGAEALLADDETLRDVLAKHRVVACSHAGAGRPTTRWWLCEWCQWESPHRGHLMNEEAYGHQVDAIRKHLIGGKA